MKTLITSADSPLEKLARNEIVCRGCGKEKDIGGIVCWGCFKYNERLPVLFKYFDGTLEQWLKAIQV